MKLQKGDLLKFKNGSQRIFGENDGSIMKIYYDSDMNCKNDDNYTIVEVLRPEYKKIYEKGKVLKK